MTHDRDTAPASDRRCAPSHLGPGAGRRSLASSPSRRSHVPLWRLLTISAELSPHQLPPPTANASPLPRRCTWRPSGTSADPVGETRWVHDIAGATRACLMPWWRRPGSTAPDVAELLAAAGGVPAGAERAPQAPSHAGRPQDARRGKSGSMDCPRMASRANALLARHKLSLRPADALVALRCRRRSSRAIFPGTTVIVNHTGLPADRSAEGLARWRRALRAAGAGAPMSRSRFQGLGVPGPALDAPAAGPVVRDAIAMFGAERAMFASNFPVNFASHGHVRRGLRQAFSTITPGHAGRRAARAVPRQCGAGVSVVMEAWGQTPCLPVYRLDATSRQGV